MMTFLATSNEEDLLTREVSDEALEAAGAVIIFAVLFSLCLAVAAPAMADVAIDDFATAKTAMQQKLTDPMSAQWQDLFKVSTPEGEIICGKVNSKNKTGGYVGATGFIFEKRLNRATLMYSGTQDPDYTIAAAAAYCIYCTTDRRGDLSIVGLCPDLIKASRR